MFQKKVNITRIHKGERKEELDTVLIESSVDIFVNSNPLVNIICLNKDLKELALGFLFSIGIIDGMDDVSIIKVDSVEGKVYVELMETSEIDLETMEIAPVSRVIDTTCGIPSPWRKLIKEKLIKTEGILEFDSELVVNSELIFTAIIEMQKNTPLFKETGGCHGAAIFDFRGILIAVKEDVGRHNAIDKVIGSLILNRHSFENKILTSTGRLTGDTVLKAVRAKIPIISSF